MPLPIFLEKIGLASNIELEISETIRVLEKISCENSPEKPSGANFSKTLASDICGTIPVVYGFGIYRAVAQRLKTQFNENSKIPAKWECLPELDHNEIVGWEEVRKLADCFSIILVRDDTERIEMKQRIEVTKDLMQKEALRIFEVWTKGKSSLAKMSSTICVGDFTSVYLAILRGIDPTPVKTITLLKERLKQTGTKERIIRELESVSKP
jgi:glucose/mannose-6-phosphate isomerase